MGNDRGEPMELALVIIVLAVIVWVTRSMIHTYHRRLEEERRAVDPLGYERCTFTHCTGWMHCSGSCCHGSVL